MTNEYKPAIAKLYEDLDKASAKVSDIKKAINMLSALSGESEPFADVGSTSISGKIAIRSDQFFGKSFASSAKEYLRMKGQSATAEEILKGLEDGGFEFPLNWKQNLRLKNTAISLGKNSNDFVYVKSSNSYGLWEFYPDKKKEKKNVADELIDKKMEEKKEDNGGE